MLELVKTFTGNNVSWDWAGCRTCRPVRIMVWSLEVFMEKRR